MPRKRIGVLVVAIAVSGRRIARRIVRVIVRIIITAVRHPARVVIISVGIRVSPIPIRPAPIPAKA